MNVHFDTNCKIPSKSGFVALMLMLELEHCSSWLYIYSKACMPSALKLWFTAHNRSWPLSHELSAWKSESERCKKTSRYKSSGYALLEQVRKSVGRQSRLCGLSSWALGNVLAVLMSRRDMIIMWNITYHYITSMTIVKEFQRSNLASAQKTNWIDKSWQWRFLISWQQRVLSRISILQNQSNWHSSAARIQLGLVKLSRCTPLICKGEQQQQQYTHDRENFPSKATIHLSPDRWFLRPYILGYSYQYVFIYYSWKSSELKSVCAELDEKLESWWEVPRTRDQRVFLVFPPMESLKYLYMHTQRRWASTKTLQDMRSQHGIGPFCWWHTSKVECSLCDAKHLDSGRNVVVAMEFRGEARLASCRKGAEDNRRYGCWQRSRSKPSW